MILVGIASDRIRVRKPFMVIGAVGAIVMTIVFLNLGAHTDYATFAVVTSILAVCLGTAYAPWMASFTETVEKHNPALTATGLAVWGWIIRAVIVISLFVLPSVVGSMTPLVMYRSSVATLSAKYAPELATLSAIDPKTQAALEANPANTAAATTAVGEIAKAFSISPAAVGLRLATVPRADLLLVAAHGKDVVAAAAPGQWKNWW